MPLSDGKTDGVGETLAKRAGGYLNTGGVVRLRVTRSDRVDLLRLSDRVLRHVRLVLLTRKFFRSSMLMP